MSTAAFLIGQGKERGCGQAARVYNTLQDQAMLTSGYSWDGVVSSRSLIAEARPHLAAGAAALTNVIELWDRLLPS